MSARADTAAPGGFGLGCRSTSRASRQIPLFPSFMFRTSQPDAVMGELDYMCLKAEQCHLFCEALRFA